MFQDWEQWRDCTFCSGFRKLAGGNQNAFFEDYGISSEYKLLIKETNGLALIPDIAPLSEDHLLLITKLHIPSFAVLPSEYLSEAERILLELVSKMSQLHPDSEVLVFEHGVGVINGKVVKCGTCNRTDHAHLHILPVPKTHDYGVAKIIVDKILQEYPLKRKIADAIPKIAWKTQVGELPYLLLWSSLDARKTYLMIQESSEILIASQIIRKWVGVESLRLQESDTDLWDWRNLIGLYPTRMEKMIERTLKRWGDTKEKHEL